MKLGNYISNSGVSNHYLDQAKNSTSKALNNISAQRALSGVDSANLAIADSLRSQSSVLEQGIANANDSIGILQIADSTLSNISQSADKINEMSVRRNSGLLNESQKAMIDSQANALVDSMKDSVKQASFNGKDVFSGEMNFLTGSGMQSINLSSPNFSGIDVTDQKSVTNFIDNVNSMRGEIGAAQNGILSGINSSIAQHIALKSSESQLQNNDVARNINEQKQSELKITASLVAQAHNTANLQSQFGRLLG
ncbi:MAG: flagellin [Campylobacter sp.]